MKSVKLAVFMAAIGLTGLGSAQASAATPSPYVPWTGCEQMTISKVRSEPYNEQELKTLYCWLGLSNIDAGLEIARHYERVSPPDLKAARKMLLDLAKGTRSIAAA